MPCSAVTLSLATICGVASAALLGIAFGTDNWKLFKVSKSLEQRYPQEEKSAEINSLYLTRSNGLFRTCFEEKPDPAKVPTEISPVETNCMYVDYFMSEQSKSLSDMTDVEQTRIYFMRTMIGLFIVSFVFLFVSFFTGLSGCWRRSPANIGATAVLTMFASICSGAAMGLYHAIEYYETDKLGYLPFRAGWKNDLKNNTVDQFGWSYFIAWVGVAFSAVAAILFFSASVCLRNERYREDRKNMSYIMPVYGQKQQYASYGYGYPGPYHYPSQAGYGHYSYQ